MSAYSGEVTDPDILAFQRIDDEACRAFLGHVELVGRKWNSAILLAAVRGARRFSEYRASIIGISDRLLALRLKELEQFGLIERRVTPTTPVLIEYLPTEAGRSLLAALQPIARWGSEHSRSGSDSPAAGTAA